MGKLNSKVLGNHFQEDFAKSIPEGIYAQRLRDMGIGFKKVDNPGDYLVFPGQYLLVVECKSTKEKNLPLTNIRMNQLWKMLNACTKNNVYGGYIIEYRELGVCYFVEVATFTYWYLYARTGKNLPFNWVQEHGYKVARSLIRTRHRYGVQGIFNWVKENCWCE